MSADLRARIAEALTNWVLNASRSAEASRIVPIPETVHANSLLRTDVVMTVVQPELDAKDAEIGRLAIGHRSLNQASIEALERAEQAEAEVKRLTDLNAQYADRGIENGQRAEQLAAELKQWRACFGETALKDARGVLAERDRLRAADGRVREIHQPVPCSNMRHDGGNGQHCGVCEYDDIGGNIWPCPTIRALDQAPAAESPYASGGEILPRTQGDQIPAQLSGCDYAINPEPAAEQDGGGQ